MGWIGFRWLWSLLPHCRWSLSHLWPFIFIHRENFFSTQPNQILEALAGFCCGQSGTLAAEVQRTKFRILLLKAAKSVQQQQQASAEAEKAEAFREAPKRNFSHNNLFFVPTKTCQPNPVSLQCDKRLTKGENMQRETKVWSRIGNEW